MSRDPRYQKLLNSKRWKMLRQWKIQRDPLCEACKAEGKVVSMVDVHHKVPVETGHTIAEMEALCYDPNNLQSLCIPCHIKAHQLLNSRSVEVAQERKQARLERWIDKNSNHKYVKR